MKKTSGKIGLLGQSAVVVALGSGLIFVGPAQASQDQSPATAQGSATNDDDQATRDIIVTAQKREERLQDVPAAITAITAEDIARTGTNTVEKMVGMVPNLSLGQSFGVAHVTLRGIGLANYSPGAEGSIAFHVNNVFISRGSDVFGSFYDLDRVEVLRGPQGTLFGRNATGGSFNVLTRRPTPELDGYAQLTIGSYDRLAFEGAVGGPLAGEKLMARLAVQSEERTGYGKNLVSGEDIDDADQRSVRASLTIAPTDRLKFDIVADLHRENDHAFALHYFGPAAFFPDGSQVPVAGLAFLGGYAAINSRNVASDISQVNDRKSWGVMIDGQYDLGVSTLRSISAYRNTRYRTVADGDNTSAVVASPMEQAEKAHQYSSELQLLGESGRWTWLGGLFYFNEKTSGGFRIPIQNIYFVGPPGYLSQGFLSGGTLKTDAAAIFGQASYKLTPELKVTAGARYSWEKKSVDEFFTLDPITPFDADTPVVIQVAREDEKSFKSFTPKLGIDYQPNRDLLLYASYSKGFKSGTFNLGAIQPALSPEKVTAYEGGIKSTWARGLAQVNVAGFYYDYKDLQVGKSIRNIPALENAATATIYGAELEFNARPIRSIRTDLVFSYLNAKFDEYISADPFYPAGDGTTVEPATGEPAFDLSGNRVPQAPEFSLLAGLEYILDTRAGEFSLRGEASWTDEVFFTAFNRPDLGEEARTLFNAYFNFTDPAERIALSIYGRNLTNKKYATDMFPLLLFVGGAKSGFFGEPRTYGATVRYNF